MNSLLRCLALTLVTASVLSAQTTIRYFTYDSAYNTRDTTGDNLTLNTPFEDGSVYSVENGTFSGTGSITKIGGGLLIFGDYHTYTGGTIVQEGILRLIYNDQLAPTGALLLNGGTLDLSGTGQTFSRLSGAGQIWNGGLTVKQNDTTVFSGVLANTNLFLGGTDTPNTGTLTLSGGADNAFSTATVNDGSTLILAKTSSGGVHAVGGFGDATVLTVNAGGTARLAGTGDDQIFDYTNVVVNRNEGAAEGHKDGTLDFNGRNETFSKLTGAGVITNSAAGTASTLTLGTLDASSTFDGKLQDGAGTLALAKTGGGTLTLTGTNTYTGNTTVEGGTLVLTQASSFYNGVVNATTSGRLTFNANTVQLNVGGTGEFTGADVAQLAAVAHYQTGATLALDTGHAGNNTVVLSNSFSGGLGLTKFGTGTLQLGDSGTTLASWSQVRVSGGTLALGRDQAIGRLTGNSSTIDLADHTLTIGHTDANSTYGGVIQGTGAVVKTGAGSLQLAGVNTYTGGTTLKGGELLISTDRGLGDAAGNVTFDGGTLIAFGNITSNRATTLESGGGTFYVDNSSTLAWNGAITGTGDLTKIGAGTLELGGTNTYSGTTFINGGTLRLTSSDAFSPYTIMEVSDYGTFDANGFTQTLGALTGSGVTNIGSGNLIVGPNAGTSTYSGTITGTGQLVKSGAGTLVLASTTGFTGNTLLSDGTLQLADALALQGSTLRVKGGELSFGALTSATFGGLKGTQSIALKNTNDEAVALTVGGNGASTTYEGVLSGTGSLTKAGAGTLTLTGENIYTGGTTVSAGVLQIGDGGYSGSLTGNISVENHANLTFKRISLTYGDVISGEGSVTVADGPVTLTGNNTYTGGTLISGGSLSLGTGGSLATTGALTITGGNFDLNGHTQTVSSLSGTGGQVSGGSLTTNQTGNTTFSGTLSTTQLTLDGPGTLTLSGGAYNWHATAVVNAGTLILAKPGNALDGDVGGTALTINSGGTVRLGGDQQIFYGSNVVVNTGVDEHGAPLPGVLDLSGHTQYLNGLSGGGVVTNSSGTASLLDLGAFGASSTFSGSLKDGAGTLTLIKEGNGTLTLNGANNYSGTTTVNGGTLTFGQAASFYNGIINAATGGRLIVNSATAQFNVGGTGEFTSADLGQLAASAHFNSAAALALDTTNAAGGKFILGTAFGSDLSLIKIGSGTLQLGDATHVLPTWGKMVVNEGTLSLGVADKTFGALGGTGGAVNLSGHTLTIAQADGYSNYAGVIQGEGSLVKTGNGLLELTGINTYTDGTTLKGGTLAIHDDRALGDASAVLIFDGGRLGVLDDVTSARDVTLNAGGGTFDVDTSRTLTLSGNITGGGALTKDGFGTLVLSGTNTYGGTTFVKLGTLRLDSDGAFSPNTFVEVMAGATFDANGHTQELSELTGTGTTKLNNGYLTVGPLDGTSTYGGTLAGNGGLAKTGAGTLVLTNASPDFIGTAVLADGTLRLENSLALQSATLRAIGGTLDLNSLPAVTFGGLSGTQGIALTNDSSQAIALTVGSNGASTLYSGVLSGSGSLTKEGTGTLTLSNDNTYSGGTTVNAGVLEVGDGGYSGSLAGDVSVAEHADLRFNRGGLTYDGVVSGAGSLTKTGPDTVTLSAVQTYTGGTNLVGGTLALADDNRLDATGAVTFNGGALDLTNHSQTVSSLSGASGQLWNGTLTTTQGGNTTFSGEAIFSTIVLDGSGTLTLAGSSDNAYSHAIVNSGTLVLAKDTTDVVHSVGGNGGETVLTINDGGTVRIAGTGGQQIFFATNVQANAGGLLDLNGRNESFAGLSGDGTLTNAATGTASTLKLGMIDASSTFAGALQNGAGTLALTKTGGGTLTLSGNNTYTGATTVEGGILALTGSGTIGQSYRINIASGATLDVMGLGGSFALNAGQTLGGTGTVSGLATISSGAHIAPGNSPGTITFDGGLILADGAVLDFQLGSPLDYAASDHINVVNGAFSLGHVQFNFTDAGDFGAGTYDLIHYTTLADGSLAGALPGQVFTFGSVIPGYTYSFALNGGVFQLIATTAVPEPSTYAILAGVLALGIACWRRRRVR